MIDYITGEIPTKNMAKINLKKDNKVLILSSMFDSGNMGRVEVQSNNSIIIYPVNDCSGTIYESHAKGWFHFSVSGAILHSKIKFIIRKMTQLSSQSKVSDYFKPVYKYEKQEWQRVMNSNTIVDFAQFRQTKEDDTELQFQFQFQKLGEVFFAYTFPFSFEDCQKMLKKIYNEFKKHKSIYYNDQIIIMSPEGRPIHLLTLSSHQGKLEEKQPLISQHLFSQSHTQPSNKFSKQKKVIIISARVHPGQAPASHTFNGLLKFLLSKDARAYMLRKHFVFKMIPILNPDGVANGHYRMDIFNQNLNRFYIKPEPFQQPSAYAVKKIGQYYAFADQLCFYLDLHAHPQKKGNFIYGNSFQSHIDQVQTQLFPKLLALNCIQFDYQYSSFAEKHMTAKDKNQDLTKQGCGRVVFQKQLKQIYSYTLQCGYTSSTYLNEIVPIQNGHRKFQKLGIISDQMENLKSPYYANKKNIYFTIKCYQNLGKSILVSILDLFEQNPASRLPNTEFKNLQGIRKQISAQINKMNTNNFRIYVMKGTSQNINIARKQKQTTSQKTIPNFNKKKSIQKRNTYLHSIVFGDKVEQKIHGQKKNVSLPKVTLQKLLKRNLSKKS